MVKRTTDIEEEKIHTRTETVKEVSRLKELEEKLRVQILENPTKPLNYRLINDLQNEAARTIQHQFKLKKKFKEEELVKHGKFVDRKV